MALYVGLGSVWPISRRQVPSGIFSKNSYGNHKRLIMSLVELQGVRKDYKLGKSTIKALKDINLSIDHDEFLAIVGPSGSGKTTLLNLIGCIERPTSGKILIDGMDVQTLSEDQLADIRASNFGFIFQTFNLIPVLTAEENVELALLKKSLSAAERKKLVFQALHDVGLYKFKDHKPDEMSGGQRQRVAIARAIVRKPKIILADEPTANLDHETGLGILNLMRDMNRKYKTLFIFSTHDPKVMAMASRQVVLSDGRLETT